MTDNRDAHSIQHSVYLSDKNLDDYRGKWIAQQKDGVVLGSGRTVYELLETLEKTGCGPFTETTAPTIWRVPSYDVDSLWLGFER